MKKDVLKHDVSENWEKAKNFIPAEGEFIYYDDLNKFKIGDGKTNVNNLNFSIRTYNGERSVQ